jgi:aminoglycoside phosphotransferase (APT) family kinase protein
VAQAAEAALRPWTPVFTHGDLQITHVFVDGDEVTGVIDWSEAGQGDAPADVRSVLTVVQISPPGEHRSQAGRHRPSA